jgi:hypothetical protein
MASTYGYSVTHTPLEEKPPEPLQFLLQHCQLRRQETPSFNLPLHVVPGDVLGVLGGVFGVVAGVFSCPT